MIEIGTYVYYVPSHDQEYKHVPSIGVVTGVEETLMTIYDGKLKMFFRISPEYIADTKNEEEVIKLLGVLNNNWLNLQHLLYRIELAVMNLAPAERLIVLIKSIKHYHIN